MDQSDLPAYRVIRLEALQRHPEAFLSAYEDEAAEALDTYKRMIAAPPSATFGCFVDDALVGIAGLIVSPRAKLPKTKHALPATHTHTHGKTNSYVWLVDARSVRPDLLRRARCGVAVCAAAR